MIKNETKLYNTSTNTKRVSLGIRPVWDVFLGGACNPTTWRDEIAIPFLKQAGITYFNPQVKDWYPELMASERQAKVSSRLLLFVFDPSQTRGLASLVEVAFLIGRNCDLVIVLPQPDALTHCVINGEELTQREMFKIREGFAFVKFLVESKNLPVFKTISTALQAIHAVIKKGLDLTSLPGSTNSSLIIRHQPHYSPKQGPITLPPHDLELQSLTSSRDSFGTLKTSGDEDVGLIALQARHASKTPETLLKGVSDPALTKSSPLLQGLTKLVLDISDGFKSRRLNSSSQEESLRPEASSQEEEEEKQASTRKLGRSSGGNFLRAMADAVTRIVSSVPVSTKKTPLRLNTISDGIFDQQRRASKRSMVFSEEPIKSPLKRKLSSDITVLQASEGTLQMSELVDYFEFDLLGSHTLYDQLSGLDRSTALKDFDRPLRFDVFVSGESAARRAKMLMCRWGLTYVHPREGVYRQDTRSRFEATSVDESSPIPNGSELGLSSFFSVLSKVHARCSVLLLCITSLDVLHQLQAANAIGTQRKVVLCVDPSTQDRYPGELHLASSSSLQLNSEACSICTGSVPSSSSGMSVTSSPSAYLNSQNSSEAGDFWQWESKRTPRHFSEDEGIDLAADTPQSLFEPDPCHDDYQPLTSTSLADYERALRYIICMANEMQIPVATSLEDAVDMCLSILGRVHPI